MPGRRKNAKGKGPGVWIDFGLYLPREDLVRNLASQIARAVTAACPNRQCEVFSLALLDVAREAGPVGFIHPASGMSARYTALLEAARDLSQPEQTNKVKGLQ